VAAAPWVRFGAIPAAGLALILFFIFLGFPYTQLADTLATHLGRQSGVELSVASLGPNLALQGPVLEATGVSLRLTSGDEIELDRARLRPAWSLSWFRGAPAVHAVLEGPLGEATGVFTLGSVGAWRGELRQINLAELPLSDLWPGFDAEGIVDASLDLTLGDRGVEGWVAFEAFEGSLTLPEIPVAVPFDRIEATLALGGESILDLEMLRLDGPLLRANVTGRIAQASNLNSAALSLSVEIDSEPGIRSLLESAGLTVERDGKARLRVDGTVGSPNLR